MRRVLAALMFGGILVVPLQATGVQRAVAAPPARDKCGPPPSKNYKCPSSAIVPASGTFTVALSGTKLTLRGIASRTTLKSQIYLAKVTVASVPKHGQAFKVFTSGRIPALTLTGKGNLYRYNVSRGTWQRVGAITSAGIYAAILA
ncbi:MAG TPA: hypothetical protein VF221_20285 [Chloroflexota bacterium]